MPRSDAPRAALVDLLTAGRTRAEIAAALAVSESTVTRRLAADVTIRETAEQQRAEMLETVAARILAASFAAATRLADLVNSANEQTALGACRAVLDQAVRYREVAVLEQQVGEVLQWRADGLRALPTYDAGAGRWRTG